MSGPASTGQYVPGKSVEQVADRTDTMKVFSNPDGSHTAEISLLPLHFRDPAKGGAWSDIDSSLIPDPSRPGWLRSKANSWTVRFGPSPQVEIDGASGSVQTMAPVGGAAVAPVVGPDGQSVTYSGVWPNVDLRYVVSSAGVEEDIVVNGPPGRSSFDFATGHTSYNGSAGGGMTPVGAGSGALSLLPPMVLDSNWSPVPQAAPSLTAISSGGGAGVRVSVSSSWSPSYPYVIDPSYGNGSSNMTAYESNNVGTQIASCACPVRIGNSQSSGDTYWRSVGYFNMTHINGDAVNAASFELDNRTAGSANAYNFGIYQASAWSFGGAPAWGPYVSGQTTNGGSYGSSGLAKLYNSWTESRQSGGVLGFGGQESAGVYTYKQFSNYLLYLTYYTFPTAPSESAPANGATIHTLTPTLSASATNADGTPLYYYYRVATSSDAETNVVCNSGWGYQATSYYLSSPCSLNWNTSYYWHAYAWDGQTDANGNAIMSSAGPVQSFTTQNRPPSIPGLVSPGSTSSTPLVNTPTPTFTANASTDPDGDPVSYDFQVATGTNGQTGVLASSGWQSANTWTPPAGTLQDGGTYYWTAIAEDNYGFQSSWASALGFKVDTTLPAIPAVTSSTDPSQTAWYPSGSFTGSWTSSDANGIAGYSVALDNNPATNPANTVSQTTASYSAANLGSGVWYLHVKAEDNAGNWSTTATYSFDVETPTPSWQSPTEGTSPGTETLTVGSGPTATGATFQAYISGAWQTIATTTTPGNSSWTATWNTAAMTAGSYNLADGPYLVGVQLNYPGGPGPLDSGPVVWVENHGPTLPNETTGSSNPSEPNVVLPTTAAVGSAAHAAIDDSKGALDVKVTDSQTAGPSAIPLELTRTYDSGQAGVAGPFGMGWSDNYNLTMHSDPTFGSSTLPAEDVVQENGSVVRFAQDGQGKWVAPSQVNATLVCTQTSNGNCTSWTFTRGGQLTYVFNGSGLLQSITDLGGYTTVFGYTASQLTTITTYTVANYATVTNPTSRTITLTWGACGSNQCVTTLTDPAGRTVTYSYNSASDLTGVKDVAGNWTNYGYNNSNQIVTIQDPAGTTTAFGYTNNRVSCEQTAATTCPGQPASTWSYSLDSNATGTVTIVDPSGNQTDTLADSQLTAAAQPNNTATAGYDDLTGGASTLTTGCASPTSCSGGEQSTVTYNDNPANPTPGSVDDIVLRQDAAGNVTQTSYTANNQIWCQVDPADYANGTRCPATQPTVIPAWNQADPYPGATINYYNGTLLAAVMDPLGNITAYAYTAATDPPGANLQYCSVDPADYKKQVTCPAYGAAHVTGTTTETYDTSGRKLTETDPDGNTSSYNYSAPGLPDKVSTMMDPEGTVTTYTYDPLGDVTATTVTFGAYTASTLDAYDANGRKYCEVAPYEAAKGVTCPATPPTSAPAPGNDPYLGATITTYDPDGRVTQTTNPLGGITLTAYDTNGNAYCSVAPAQAATGVTCPSGAPTSAPTPGNDAYLGAIINTYDNQNRLIQVTNPLGGITLNQYDLNNNITQTTVESNSPSDPTVVTANSYDADNRLASKTVGYGTSLAQTTLDYYDPNGKVYCTISGKAYAAGTAQCPTWQPNWITAPPAPSSLYSTQPTTAQANQVTTTFYNADGQQLQTTNPNIGTTVNAVDGDGRTYCTSDPTNVATWLAAHPSGTWPYICPATPPTTASASGYILTIYDPAGRTLSTTDPAGDTTSYTYTPSGKKLTVTDPRGQITTNCYYYQNSSGQCAQNAPAAGGAGGDLYSTTTPATAADPAGETTTYTYYPGGQTATTNTPAGTTRNTYDATSDVTTVTYTNTAAGYSTPANVTTTYNLDGTRHTVTDATGTTTYSYNQNGDVTTQALAATGSSANKTVGYSYYNTGTLSTITYPSYGTYTSPTATYTYDQTGAMTSVTDWLGNQITFSHDQDGNTTSQNNNVSGANPHGTSSTAFTYDLADNNTQTFSTLAQTCGGTETLTQTFSGTGGARNPDGQVTQDSETYNGSCSAQSGYQRNYSYDQAGRVTYQGNNPQGANANNFAYDPSGDPTTISNHDSTGNFNTFTQAFDNPGEITSQGAVSGSGGAVTTYTYDTLGDQIQAASAGASTNYNFDQLGKMTGASSAGGSSTYLYNADGLEAVAYAASGTSQLTWDSRSSLALLFTDDAADYIYGPSLAPVEQIRLSDSTATYLTYVSSDNAWLSANLVGDETGYWRYDAYGTLAFGTPTSPFGYSGQYTDTTTGLVNDRARWYEAQSGLFTTTDPAYAATGTAYTYANDDPIGRFDPQGLTGHDQRTTGNYYDYLQVTGKGNHVDSVFTIYENYQTDPVQVWCDIFVRPPGQYARPALIWEGYESVGPARWIYLFGQTAIVGQAAWFAIWEGDGESSVDEINQLVHYSRSNWEWRVQTNFYVRNRRTGRTFTTQYLSCWIHP